MAKATATETTEEYGDNPWLVIHRRMVNGVEEITDAMTLDRETANSTVTCSLLVRTRIGDHMSMIKINNARLVYAANHAQAIYSGAVQTAPVMIKCHGAA